MANERISVARIGKLTFWSFAPLAIAGAIYADPSLRWFYVVGLCIALVLVCQFRVAIGKLTWRFLNACGIRDGKVLAKVIAWLIGTLVLVGGALSLLRGGHLLLQIDDLEESVGDITDKYYEQQDGDGRAAAMLLKAARNGNSDHDDFLDAVAGIPAESLLMQVHRLADSADVSLYCYRHNRLLPDGSILKWKETTAAFLLVNGQTGSIVDSMALSGNPGVIWVMDEGFSIDVDIDDGKARKVYDVSTNGFGSPRIESLEDATEQTIRPKTVERRSQMD